MCGVDERLISLAATDFALFEVSAQFAQDRAVLDSRWKALQRQAHPDRFAAQGGAAQRQAMQWSVRINEAYQRLKDPLKRAAYLCELAGAAVNAESNTAMPAQFLMQQMQWREDLDDATDMADMDALHADLKRSREETLARCGHLLDVQHDAKAAVAEVRALMFIERFAGDLDRRAEQLESHQLAAGNTAQR